MIWVRSFAEICPSLAGLAARRSLALSLGPGLGWIFISGGEVLPRRRRILGEKEFTDVISVGLDEKAAPMPNSTSPRIGASFSSSCSAPKENLLNLSCYSSLFQGLE